MSVQDGDSTQTSRTRLLNAGKMLFAQNGYEQTSTAAIAREAGSSESQLIRYFSGKAGLLEAIFNDAWAHLQETMPAQLSSAEHGRDALIRLLELFIRAMSADHDIAFLFLFEGRRPRGATHDVLLSKGYVRFAEGLDLVIRRGIADGSFRTDLNEKVLASALLGCAEGMIRDRVLALRNNQPMPFDDDTIVKTFTAMANGLAP